MFGLPWWGTLTAAVITGGGMVWALLRMLRQGQVDKVRADNAEAKIDGDRRANETEARLKEARDNALNQEHPDDEL